MRRPALDRPPQRRLGVLALQVRALLPLLLLVACAGSVPPPARLLLLPLAAPEVPAAAVPGGAWQLVEPVRLPAYLDREALMQPRADGTLLASESQRWAEPLRDALPRLLREDLAAWRGGAPIWSAPLPAALQAERRLRVEILQMDLLPGRHAVQLTARWTLEDPAGAQAPRPGRVQLTAEGATAAAAHRLALWRLAGAIAATR